MSVGSRPLSTTWSSTAAVSIRSTRWRAASTYHSAPTASRARMRASIVASGTRKRTTVMSAPGTAASMCRSRPRIFEHSARTDRHERADRPDSWPPWRRGVGAVGRAELSCRRRQLPLRTAHTGPDPGSAPMTLTICCSVRGGQRHHGGGRAGRSAPQTQNRARRPRWRRPSRARSGRTAGARASRNWSISYASADAIADLTMDVDSSTRLVPRGPHPIDRLSAGWPALAEFMGGAPPPLRHRHRRRARPAASHPRPVEGDGRRALLVTRPCYLSLVRAAAMPWRADGVVLVNEPWRSLRAADIERALGIPVRLTWSSTIRRSPVRSTRG